MTLASCMGYLRSYSRIYRGTARAIALSSSRWPAQDHEQDPRVSQTTRAWEAGDGKVPAQQDNDNASRRLPPRSARSGHIATNRRRAI